MTDRLFTATTRTPLADVDTSRFDLGIEKACALVDRLQAEKAELLAALKECVSLLDFDGYSAERATAEAAIAHAEGRA